MKKWLIGISIGLSVGLILAAILEHLGKLPYALQITKSGRANNDIRNQVKTGFNYG
ncbi:hypothetical protein AGMMS49938_02000 [Fibrobacterales bacterium]|nr:hypothetical protein AGMMS49938_02000 [Fibrobacterales bacterium]